jgi:D-alanyl-D-alanine carboxypeptidase (penicillin-binding protein 5/6)
MRRTARTVLTSLCLLVVVLAVAVAGRTIRATAQSPPPPTPVPPLGSPSPYPTALATPSPSSRPPELAAASSALVHLDSGRVLVAHRAGDRRPVASTTKIMTALLVLEEGGPNQRVTVSSTAAAQGGASLGLRAGERRRTRELVAALMLQSANDAAVALAEHVAGTVDAFVDRMNDRVDELGLRDTRFESPNGLDDRGYSTARDLARITVEAFRNEIFAEVVGTRFARIPAPDGPDRRIQNRNALLWLYPGAIGVKTGYTAAAGFCLVAAGERDGLRLVSVVLGAPHEAFSASATLLNHGFEAYELRRVVEAGDAFPPLRVGGRDIPVEAAADLDLVLRREQGVTPRVRPKNGLALPVAAGARVGRVIVQTGERRLGSVPLVAAEAVTLPPPEPVPWWRRAWDAIQVFVGTLFEAIFA